MSAPGRVLKRQRGLQHQCQHCRRHWALTLADTPSGRLVVCRYCGTPRTPPPDVSPGGGQPERHDADA